MNAYSTATARKSSWVTYAVIGLLVSLLAAVTLLWWREKLDRFPRIPPGHYSGTLALDLNKDELGEELPVFVRSGPDSAELLVVVLESGWQPQRVVLVSRGSDESAAAEFFPVTLSAPQGIIKLTGAAAADGSFAGSVVSQRSGHSGNWTLKPAASRRMERIDGRDFELWALLKQELQEIDSRVAEAEGRVRAQRAEIDKLTNFVTEGQRLRKRADEKYEEVRQQLKNAEGGLQRKQEEADLLEKQIENSQRVTRMGKLVSLARDSLEREGRWIQSLLVSSPGGDPERLEAEYLRGLRVLELKQQIAAAEGRLAPRDPEHERGAVVDYSGGGR